MSVPRGTPEKLIKVLTAGADYQPTEDDRLMVLATVDDGQPVVLLVRNPTPVLALNLPECRQIDLPAPEQLTCVRLQLIDPPTPNQILVRYQPGREQRPVRVFAVGLQGQPVGMKFWGKHDYTSPMLGEPTFAHFGGSLKIGNQRFTNAELVVIPASRTEPAENFVEIRF